MPVGPSVSDAFSFLNSHAYMGPISVEIVEKIPLIDFFDILELFEFLVFKLFSSVI